MTDRHGAPDGEPGIERAGRPSEVEELRREVERQREMARRSGRLAQEREEFLRDELARTRASLTKAKASLAKTRQRLEGIQRRWAYRAAARATRIPGSVQTRIVRAGHALAALGPSSSAPRPVGPDDERVFVQRLVAGLTSTVEHGRLVSIVMLNRDGSALLRRCLPTVLATSYRPIELIVVDNGSTDDSVAYIEGLPAPFPIRVIRNESNHSFSDGNNQGAAAATGDWLLLLNNDVEPIDPRWLGYLIETGDARGAAAVGARLVYPRREPGDPGVDAFPELTLQHGGIGFRMDDGMPIAVPLDAGGDALAADAGVVRDAVALTAACLLVRRSAFEAAGGFTPGYDYGQEDVDLCLKLREAGGRLVYDGRAALWHRESSTRDELQVEQRRARNRANRDRFVGRWGPRLHRTVMREALDGGTTWRRHPFQLAVTAGDGRLEPLVAAADARGWKAVAVPSDAITDVIASFDAVISNDPGLDLHGLPLGLISVAVVDRATDDWMHRPWFDDYDVVLVPDDATASAIDAGSAQRAIVVAGNGTGALDKAVAGALRSWVDRRRISILLEIPSRPLAEAWGDLHFARSVQKALRRHDRPTRVHLKPAWSSWAVARDDVRLQILGRTVAQARPAQVNALWQISHPDHARVEAYDREDVCFVASDRFAAWMGDQSTAPVVALHQATDPDRFSPRAGGPHHEILFVANSRNARRHVLDDLLPTEHELAVYGRGWTPDRIDPRYVAGEGIPNRDLAAYYAAASIVLNDHWPDMEREGFLSNRLYDAAAAGGFVISDEVEGLDGEFDGGIVMYRDARQLRADVDHFLANPAERRARAERARQAVLARHTFEQRARTIVDTIDPLLSERPEAI